MGRNILIIGKSGCGKTASIRNMTNTLVINVLDKPMPFKNSDNLIGVSTKDPRTILGAIKSGIDKGCRSVVIDDAGYILLDKFMSNHRGAKGNAMFELYNEIADTLYGMVKYTNDQLPANINIYYFMHENVDDYGNIKPKTIGKLLDDKVCLEGMFAICLRAIKKDKQYLFTTQTDGCDCVKSPMGMFENELIDNDLAQVDNKVREYYGE